jgi:molecular chaperone DnaK
LVETRNQAEALVHSAEKALKDYGDKVSAADKSVIEAAITETRGLLASEDAEALKAASNKLAEAQMKLGEAMYRDQQGGGSGGDAGPGASGGARDENVVDADFEEVKDDGKKKSA